MLPIFRNRTAAIYFLAAGTLFFAVFSASLYISRQRLADRFMEVEVERGRLLYEKVIYTEKTGRRLVELEELERRVRNILDGKDGSVEESDDADSTAPARRLGRLRRLEAGMFTLPVVWPLRQGWVTREYRPERGHTGVDIATAEGAEVFSTGNGYVKKVHEDEILGKTVEISHWGGIETLYAHNSEILVEEGDEVSADQIIALAGSTGKSSAPHLHFEVRIDGKTIDPRIHLDRDE